jgi:signal transduction histidine kinase
VVVADDTPEIRLLLRRVFEQEASFEVVGEAGDGAEAVRLVQVHQPQGVILDLAMPIMDGLEALPRIKAACPDTKILALSGFTAAEVGAEALRRGADAFLEKGVLPKQIVRTLSELVGADAPPATRANGATTDSQETQGLTSLSHHLELLSVITHELRNALIVVEGFTAVIADQCDTLSSTVDVAMVQEGLGGIARGAQHMRRLLDTLVDARRLEADVLTLRREELDLGTLVREAATDMRPLTGRHPLVVGPLPDGVTVRADATRVRQVLMNLLSNAAKFSPPDAPIEVRMTAQDRRVLVSVTDQGPGIPAGDRDKLFRKFCRLREDIKGMGLGLYVSREIMLAHDGDLTFEVPDRGGCRFVLALPSEPGSEQGV